MQTRIRSQMEANDAKQHHGPDTQPPPATLETKTAPTPSLEGADDGKLSEPSANQISK